MRNLDRTGADDASSQHPAREGEPRWRPKALCGRGIWTLRPGNADCVRQVASEIDLITVGGADCGEILAVNVCPDFVGEIDMAVSADDALT